jgi:integrase
MRGKVRRRGKAAFFVDFYWEGERYRIARDQDGYILDSFARANRLLERMRGDVDRGEFYPSNYILKEIEQFRGHRLLSRWFDTKQRFSGWHRKKTKEYLKRFYLPYFKTMDMRKLKAHHIDAFHASLPTFGEKTQKNIMTMLRNFCHWLYDNEVIPRVPRFPTIQPPEPVIKVMTIEHQKKALGALSARHRSIFSFLAHHPVRISEACVLQRKHFDLDNMVVEISQAQGYKGEIKPRKNKRPYYLPIASRFDISILRDMLPDAYVFLNQDGNLYNNNTLRKAWKRACKTAEVPYCNPYNATRHTIATEAINRGVDSKLISDALGHSDPRMMAKYSMVKAETLRNVIEAGDTFRAQVGQKQKMSEK